ncbi:MAG: hypothetical protein LBK76_04520 [Verrucomicrobiales bacterium]|nr:hypothetical protein [Verrucomicrobiales bacterium]
MKDQVTTFAPLHSDNGGADLQPGLLYLPNDSRFNSSYLSEPLTAYATGVKVDQRVQQALDFIAPQVDVARNFEFFQNVEGESFYTDADDERAIGAAFKEVKYSGKKNLGKTRNHGLTMILDDDEEGIPGFKERKVAKLKNRVLMNSLMRAYAALLAATGAGTGSVWGAGTDPDALLMQAVKAGTDDRGIAPNALLLGRAAWLARFLAYRGSKSNTTWQLSTMVLQQVAELTGMTASQFIDARYAVTKTTKAEVVGSVAIGFFSQNAPDLDDPSTVKRFVTPISGGLRVFEQRLDAKRTAITVEHYESIIGFGGAGTFRLNVSSAS